jgi:pimeloyl-ACP methyl ester carboxylesterase
MALKAKSGFNLNCMVSRKKGRPFIVFLHGLAGNHTEFFHQINFFKDKYSILAIDLLGHGN